MDFTHRYESPLGAITMASDGESLTGLWFEGQEHFAETLDPENEERMLPVFAEANRWLSLYFNGEIPDFRPPLALKGTEFRRAVWEILLAIPYGATTTYGEIAERIARLNGKKSSARAVGGAVARNPVSLIVPCHRVVGADGSMTGYAGGIERKVKLLELEKKKA